MTTSQEKDTGKDQRISHQLLELPLAHQVNLSKAPFTNHLDGLVFVLDPIFLAGYVPHSLVGTVFLGVLRYGARPQNRTPLSDPQ